MILTNHQKGFLEYIVNNHHGYGFTMDLQNIINEGEYDIKEKVMLSQLVKIHKTLLKGKSYSTKEKYFIDIDVYKKPTKYLQ